MRGQRQFQKAFIKNASGQIFKVSVGEYELSNTPIYTNCHSPPLGPTTNKTIGALHIFCKCFGCLIVLPESEDQSRQNYQNLLAFHIQFKTNRKLPITDIPYLYPSVDPILISFFPLVHMSAVACGCCDL